MSSGREKPAFLCHIVARMHRDETPVKNIAAFLLQHHKKHFRLSGKNKLKGVKRWVYEVLKRVEYNGDPTPFKADVGAATSMSSGAKRALSAMLLGPDGDPRLYLDEMQKELVKLGFPKVALSTICRALVKLNITYKMLSRRARRRSALRRALYRRQVAGIDAKCFLFCDEAGVSSQDHRRRRGRARSGQRATVDEYLSRTTGRTIIGACTVDGMVPLTEHSLLSGSVGGDEVLAWLRNDICPLLNPFDRRHQLPCSVVVLDNWSGHHVPGVRELIEAEGALLIYLPPYSPDMNPIEEASFRVFAFALRVCFFW
jgi:hypothetical protein